MQPDRSLHRPAIGPPTARHGRLLPSTEQRRVVAPAVVHAEQINPIADGTIDDNVLAIAIARMLERPTFRSYREGPDCVQESQHPAPW